MDDRIIIIDGNSLINRAYYAMQKPMITKNGLYTQGIFGFLKMLEKIRKDHPSGYIIVTFDLPEPTFRHQAYDQYKAGRKKMPPELAMELPVLKDVLDAMHIRMLSKAGYEADDLIGTVARQAEEAGLTPLIITGDKDALQLATDHTKVLITKKGISQFALYDYDTFVKEYGFTPTQFIDYKGLMGDPSDNIPGLPGVGPKTASKMIHQYGSVESLLQHTDDLKGKMKERVQDNAQLAIMSKELAAINTHVPLELDFEDCRWREPDQAKLAEQYRKLEFNSFLRQMGNHDAPETAVMPEEEDTALHLLRSRHQLHELEEAIQHAESGVLKLFGDGNHQHPQILYGGVVLIGETCWAVPLQDCELREAFTMLLSQADIAWIGHDLKRDYYHLMWSGCRTFTTAFDTAVAQYVLDPGRSNYTLTALAEEHLHLAMEEEQAFFDAHSQTDLFSDDAASLACYGRKWCLAVRAIAAIQEKQIREQELQTVLEEAELPLIEVMASMEYHGFTVDREQLEQTGAGIRARVETLTQQIWDLAGETFNIKSPAQLGLILFEKLGLPAGKKTKRGYSTSAKVLEGLTDRHPIIPLILEYRQLTKLERTYIEGLIPMIHEDGKIHAHFNQTVTATGRISSSDPNLQNIPIRQELGRQIRKAFIPGGEDRILMGADYSQIELRVLAHVSGDPALIDSFNHGEDIHRATAARVLGIPEHAITPEQRSRAKAINFGVIYGMSGFGLGNQLHITRKEADRYIRDYFAKYAAVKQYMEDQVAFCKEHGYVKTLLGRRRYIHEIGARQFMQRQAAERLAMNTPIQGTAADIIKLAMIRVNRALQDYRSSLILQVHDELIIEVDRSEEEQVRDILVHSMEDAMQLSVRLSVELNTGRNWYELK